MIASNSRVTQGAEEVKEEYVRIWVGEEGNGATQSAPFVKGVELELFILLNGLSTQGGVLHYCSPIMGIKHEIWE